MTVDTEKPAGSTTGKPARLPPPRPITPPDGVTVLTVYMVLLLGIPSGLGIGPLGAAGSPATLFGLGMLIWWMWDHLHRPRSAPRMQLVRLAMTAFCACVVASYIVAALSSLPQLDINGADRGLLRAGSLAGVLLVANDGIPGRDRLLVMLRRFVTICTIYACVGLTQFFTNQTLVDAIQIPGLTAGDDASLGVRLGFTRAQATATHALEYSSVLAMAIPLALTLALYGPRRNFLLRWFPSAALCLASVLSVSRSGIIGMAVGLLLLIPTWKPAARLVAVIISLVGAAALYVLIPGLMGTFVGLFAGASGDTSVESRTDGYATVEQLFALQPLFGRGLGTFLPSYRILDNQYLDLLVEVGVLGLIAYLGILISAMVMVRWRRRTNDSLPSALGPALCASVAAGGVLMAFFDSFSFPQASGLLLMLAGLCGAWRNLCREILVPGRNMGRRSGGTPPRMGRSLLRRWYVAAGVLACMVPLLFMPHRAAGTYYTSFNVSFYAPSGLTAGNPLWTGSGGLVQFAAMIEHMVQGGHEESIETVSAPLYGTGMKDGLRVRLPNSGGQWREAFGDPAIAVEVVAPTPEGVIDAAQRVTAEIEETTRSVQGEMGIHPAAYITTSLSPPTPLPVYVGLRPLRAELGIGVLALGMAVGATVVIDRRLAGKKRGSDGPGAASRNIVTVETHSPVPDAGRQQ